MKKTLFTLACAALAAPAFAGAAITKPITIALPATTDTPTYDHGHANSSAYAAGDRILELVEYYRSNNTSAGLYCGSNQSNIAASSTSQYKDGSLTTTAANVATVKMYGRSGVEGENVVMVLSDNQLIGKVVNSLTLTASGSESSQLTIGADFVVAVYDGTTLVGCSDTVHIDNVQDTTIQTATLTLDNITFTESNRIMIAFRGAKGTATTPYYISNIQLTATPEPATATLSLLALAGLASRRRRH